MAEENILDRVRKLLALAAGAAGTPEGELAAQRADELMTKHAIEQWELERAQRKASVRPILVQIDFQWWYDTARPIGGLLWQLFNEVAYHCRCEVILSKREGKTMPVVGFASDVSYMEMLFTHLMNQVIQQMDPKPMEGESMLSALARMKEVGLKWEMIYNRLKSAGLQEDLGPWSKSVASKCNYAGKYTKFCQETARPRMRVSPSVHRRSFISGFNQEMANRLFLMREEQGQTKGSMAPVLKDYRQHVREAIYDFYPDMRPHEKDCDCEVCVERRAQHEAEAIRESRRKPRKLPVGPKMDYGSMLSGAAAAQEVEIMDQHDASRQRRATTEVSS